jgi:formate dehydrogenase major subunit
MPLIQEIDYGTPEGKATEQVTLTIDGQQVTVPAGTSIMRAAMEAGIKVPKLCATDTLNSFGSCRVCLVEIEGRAGTPASCTTPVAQGMKVCTTSERVRRVRRGVMELYLSDHPLDGYTAPTAGNSEFQEMAGLIGVREGATDNRASTTYTRRLTPPIRISSLIPPAASCAHAACARARRPRAHSR